MDSTAAKDRQIYIGTILLELNRWGSPKTPTYRVSEWVDRFREAGFDGMELWEYHATLCSDAERDALASASFPVTVFNTYCEFEDAAEPDRQRALEMVDRVGSTGVKFNVGKDPALRETYLKNLRAWQAALPASCTPLCECHPGTILEEAGDAGRFFGDLEGNRCEVIVHCFAWDPAGLRRWFERFGPAVALAHVQFRNENRGVELLKDHPQRVRETLKVMYGEGFRGAFTIEFSRGTREPGENAADLWEAAKADLEFLRDNLS